MKKKNIIFGIICFFMIFALTGCGNKTSITTNEFTTKTKNKNYTITNVKSQYASYEYIKEATVAKSEEGFQIEFYVLDNKENAMNMFETNQKDFESNKQDNSLETSTAVGNYQKYSLLSNGYYMYICRIDNTLIYARVNETYKNTVKDLIKDLGY